MKINDLNRIALGINAAGGINIITLGFKLMRKPDKTPEEEAAARAFIKTFRWTVILVVIVCIAIAVTIGFTMSDTGMEYEGEYAESRTGRMENGQIQYVKNELYYIDPADYGLSSDLPDGTNISVYFNEDDQVVACTNQDEADAIRQQRVINSMIVMAVCIVGLIGFSLIARATFGKPWYSFVASIKEKK